jgi:thermitase
MKYRFTRTKLFLSCALVAAILPGTALAQDAPKGRQAPDPARSEAPSAPPTTADEDARGNPYVAGELIVTLEDDVSPAKTTEAAAGIGAAVQEQLPTLDAAVFTVPEVMAEGSEAERESLLAEKRDDLLADPAVESVDYNYLRTLSATPNDPRYPEQWGLTRIGAPQAWDTSTGSGSLIAIVDGGASGSHPDLAGAFVGQYDYYNGDATPNDEDGHGTHVSGIAAARRNNSVGGAGTAPNASLLNYDVCGANYCNDADINQAIIAATDRGADVINLSLGGSGSSNAQRNAVDYAWNKGTVVVAAAGNEAQDGNPISYPAAYTNAIAVGATTRSDGWANFSNYGAYVDVAAPGSSILSSIPPSGYASWDGTSMATPFVSGVAALLASQGMAAQQIRSRIETTATDLGSTGRDDKFGHGLVDADAAVAGGGTPPPPPPPGEDTTPPKLSSSVPSPEQVGVSRTATVRATASEVLDTNTVDEVNVQLYRGGDALVDAAVGCDASCRTVTLDPTYRLQARTWYLVVMWKDANGVQDLAGNPLQRGSPYATEMTSDGYEYIYWWFKTKR